MLENKSCDNCKWRTGTYCRKIKEYIMSNDWCSAWKKKKDVPIIKRRKDEKCMD